MPGKKRDLLGQRFGRLIVVGEAESKRTPCGAEAMWICRCECGTETVRRSRMLLRGRLLSCGCLRDTHGHNRRGKRTTTYRAWLGMRTRCERPTCSDYKDYGGRGIKVCERWGTFDNFLADMGECPPGRSIERRNNDGHYEHSNCYWATPIQQANNKRNTTFVTFRGERLPVSRLAARFGLSGDVLYERIVRYGWSLENAVSTPVAYRRPRKCV